MRHQQRTRLVNSRPSQRGLSLIEVTIMVSVLSALTAVLSPSIGDYVEDARRVKASSDVQVLASTFARFAYDVTKDRFLERGWATAHLLVGPGDAPEAGGEGGTLWTSAVDGQRVSRLEDHLMMNTPGYSPYGQGSRLVAPGWRGAYLSGLTSDPWGRRYAINVPHGTEAGSMIVVSPGPNGVVETAVEGSRVQASGDDVIAVVGGGR